MKSISLLLLGCLWLTGCGSTPATPIPSTSPPVMESRDPSIREIAMSCTTDMATEFHIHPMLKILINGETYVIPSEIGIVEGCMHPLHTHDAIGKMHVESPVKRDFTLGDFFFVWGQPFSKNQILSYHSDETHRIRMTVNGIESQEYERLVLKDLDEIVLYYEPR